MLREFRAGSLGFWYVGRTCLREQFLYLQGLLHQSGDTLVASFNGKLLTFFWNENGELCFHYNEKDLRLSALRTFYLLKELEIEIHYQNANRCPLCGHALSKCDQTDVVFEIKNYKIHNLAS